MASEFLFPSPFFVSVHKASSAMPHILYETPAVMAAALETLHPRLVHILEGAVM